MNKNTIECNVLSNVRNQNSTVYVKKRAVYIKSL